MFQHDAWFFVGILGLIFIIWLATGGPTRPISFAGPFLNPPAPLGNGQAYFLPQSPFAILSSPTTGGASGNTTTGSIEQQVKNAQYQVDQLKKQVADTVTFGPPSPYRGKVTLYHYVNNAGATNPKIENVQIHVSTTASGPVTITGWKLVSGVAGTSITIPGGTQIPLSGTINAAEPITLQPGQDAIITTGRSPIGASFRLNKCIGYFSQYQTFSPSLPQTCPTPKDEVERHYAPSSEYLRDTRCIDYVNSLPRCTMVPNPPTNLSYTCSALLNTYISYNGCMNAHRGDSDFLGSTWRIYLGRDASFWRTRYEVVKLLDGDGKTVDMFSY